MAIYILFHTPYGGLYLCIFHHICTFLLATLLLRLLERHSWVTTLAPFSLGLTAMALSLNTAVAAAVAADKALGKAARTAVVVPVAAVLAVAV